MLRKILSYCIFASVLTTSLSANQTATVTPVIPSDEALDFKISIEKDYLQLPFGIQSFVAATYGHKWLLFAGRANGVHGFNPSGNNFPPSSQNHYVYVVDIKADTVRTRSFYELNAELTRDEVDLLTVTSPQFYQKGEILYMTGGYGINRLTGEYGTKKVLTAVNVPEMIDWVELKAKNGTPARVIRQLEHPIFQITGGYMTQIGKGPTLLVFGQTFTGQYFVPPFTQVYSEQVRRFHIIDNGKKLAVQVLPEKPQNKEANYRRRDLNVVNIIRPKHGKLKQSLVALSGVFTPSPDDGVWTVPVEIGPDGKCYMPNPNKSSTFKQGMNNYASATLGMYSEKKKEMYTVLFGGITYGHFLNGQFQTDSNFPFTNQVTTIKLDKKGRYSQYLMSASFPLIRSKNSNPGNPLLFGAGAIFIPSADIKLYENGVVKFDRIKGKTVIGYIVGGIQSTLPNTNSQADTAASPYIFKVYIEKKKK